MQADWAQACTHSLLLGLAGTHKMYRVQWNWTIAGLRVLITRLDGRLVVCHHSAITISMQYQHSIRQFTRQPTPARVNLLPLDRFTACRRLLVTGHFLLPLRGNVTMTVAIDSPEKGEPILRSPPKDAVCKLLQVKRPSRTPTHLLLSQFLGEKEIS